MRNFMLAVSTAVFLFLSICSVGASPVPFTAFTTDTTYSSIGLTSASVRGWEFTTNAPLQITQLGYFDSHDPISGDGLGLLNSHDVGIWDSSETLLGSATVPSGTTAPLDGAFRFVSVTPIALTAGQTYVVGATHHGMADDPTLRKSEAVNLVFDPSITLVQGRAVLSSSLAYPFSPSALDHTIHLNANFKGEVVPIPGALCLLGSGLVGPVAIRRKLKA